MAANTRTLEYLQRGVNNLIEHGSFRNGSPFRPTQHDALYAYRDYLSNEDLLPEEKIKGFFELPTGIGKTALFLSILDEAHRVARAEKDHLRAMVVVPTITLLQQMKGHEGEKGDIEKWAPDYLDTVGFYGGKDRQLGKELTVISYNSWVTLMEQGKISSSNYDIVVSDEAHRGTSDRRIATKFNAFSNGTAQIAFTATARFDDEKSVEQSHGREIFARSLPDAIRLDELAAYIQTQLHIIRVKPLEKKAEFEEAADSNSGLRTGMRQEAWMRNMVKLFREGRDAHTGDLLSDNKAGFYIADTAMADRTAALLNADKELMRRAKKRGCKAVAVSIHSNLSSKEKDQRMLDFKRGKYMACASDSMMKEGFDDPTLKTVFDYPRSSLVDKSQIIGRAARKWFNEAKDRYEGATFVDTIVYVGSDDPDEDDRIKNNAIRNATMAWSVLEGAVIFSPKEEMRPRPNGLEGGGGAVVPIFGEDVESFITLEEVRAIYAEQKRLIAGNNIPYTEEMYNHLKEAIDRAKISYPKLLSSIKNLPTSINVDKIKNWLRTTDRASTVVKEEWDLVLSAAQAFKESELITLTKEMRAEFRGLADRVKTPQKTYVSILKDSDLGSCIKSARIWYNPNYSIARVKKHEWHCVINALAPHDRIVLTQEMRLDLRREAERVGLGPLSISKVMGDGRINEAKIRAWMHLKSAIKTVVIAEWDLVLGLMKNLPDKKAPKSADHPVLSL